MKAQRILATTLASKPASRPTPTRIGARLVRSIGRAALAFGLALLAAALPAAAAPRPLNAVEREALRLAIAHCERGPEAWVEALAPDSAWRDLAPGTAAEELAVRLGPPCSARWVLQTVDESQDPLLAVFQITFASGFEDAVLLRFALGADGEPLLAAVSTLAEPFELETDPPRQDGGAAALPPTDVSDGTAALRTSLPALGLGLLLSGATILWMTVLRALGRGPRSGSTRLERAGRPLLLVPAGLVLLVCHRPATDEGAVGELPESPPARAAILELRSLAALRSALASGDTLSALSAPGPAQRAVATLWQAQQLFDLQRYPEAKSTLEALPDGPSAPLRHLLEARLRFFTEDSDRTANQSFGEAYRRAIASMPPFDGLLLESSLIRGISGQAKAALQDIERAVQLGSRQAEVYYQMAALEMLDGRLEAAREAFARAWHLRPVARAEVLGDPLLSILVDPAEPLYSLLRLDAPEEPLVVDPELSSSPLATFGGVAECSGAHLRLSWEQGSLDVPGGAPLAPVGTITVAGDTWQRREEQRVLDRLAGLESSSTASGSLSDPLLPQELVIAAEALARENRWSELVALTDAIGENVRSSPPMVVNYRAAALERMGDADRSTRLLKALAEDVLRTGRRDPGTLYQLADLLALQGQYALAIGLTARANAQLPTVAADYRILQLRLEERLATRFERLESAHFEIRFPPGSEEIAGRVLQILEAERLRLGQFIPVSSGRRVEVHMLTLDEFVDRYAGSIDVIGIFDGRIRVPLADAQQLPPELVTILSHELAHAMIAELTDNRAPKWVHEGLAQLLEMVAVRVNPIGDYVRTGRLLSLPMIEESLRGLPNVKLVAAAYDESLWTFCYLYSRHGVRGIHRLLRAFREGLTTEEALLELFGTSVPEFDRRLRSWWLEDAPRSWQNEVHEYERWTDPYVQRPGERPFEVRIQSKWWERSE